MRGHEGTGGVREPERLRARPCLIGASDRPRVGHERQDVCAPWDERCNPSVRVVAGRRARQCREGGGLAEGQVCRRLAKEGPCRLVDPDDVSPEGREVQIGLEDRALAHAPFEPERKRSLFNLADDRPRQSEGHPDDLHGDRRGSRNDPSVAHVEPSRAHHTDGVDAGMLEEVAVLRGDDGVDQRSRDLVEASPAPVLLPGVGRLAELPPFGVDEPNRARGPCALAKGVRQGRHVDEAGESDQRQDQSEQPRPGPARRAHGPSSTAHRRPWSPSPRGHGATSTTAPAVRPNVSGVYISSAIVGGTA